MDLFDHVADRDERAPLAERMRPRKLSEVVGQPHLLGPDTLLGDAIRADRVPSMLLWGPPGTGKTTLASVIAAETSSRFITLSAVTGGVADIRKAVATAAEQHRVYNRRTILFVDEIHRFSKSQQDALLPHVERGTVVLIGATTENPSFSVNAALLSRARVFALETLDVASVGTLLRRALTDRERGLGRLALSADDETLSAIAGATDGDARRALTALESAAQQAKGRDAGEVTLADAEAALSDVSLRYDRNGEEHYNVVSAFIKSMRGSDPDAAVYWMMRMLEAGEDPMFVSRRMIIFASEDIGNADPNALRTAVAADTALQRLGLPEAHHALSQCCLYLSCAPKSNASYRAFTEAQADIKKHGSLPVPKKLRNAVTSLMKRAGYGKGYRYPHDEGGFAAGETYLPSAIKGRRYYRPTQNGIEARIRERLQQLRKRRAPEDDPKGRPDGPSGALER